MSQTLTKPTQCTWAPDAPFGFDFSAICAVHDLNYSAQSTLSRWQADMIFHEGMKGICDANYGGSWLCHLMADVYLIGVRLFGGAYYEGADGG